MIQSTKNQNIKYSAFTLLEMLIVLIVMGIMLMVTLFLSGDQIQKVKDKTVKEGILAEMQMRYSKNLGSSSFVGTMYDHMDVTFLEGNDEISFGYYTGEISEGQEPFMTNRLADSFKIKFITTDYSPETTSKPSGIEDITLRYTPYQISCEIGKELADNAIIIANVNNSRDYCFEIKKQNCRLIEMSEDSCKDLKFRVPELK